MSHLIFIVIVLILNINSCHEIDNTIIYGREPPDTHATVIDMDLCDNTNPIADAENKGDGKRLVDIYIAIIDNIRHKYKIQNGNIYNYANQETRELRDSEHILDARLYYTVGCLRSNKMDCPTLSFGISKNGASVGIYEGHRIAPIEYEFKFTPRE